MTSSDEHPTGTTPTGPDASAPSTERADLLESLARHRFFLTCTARDLTDEQAAARTTASTLCVGGLIKHVTAVESEWTRFVLGGAEAMAGGEEQWPAQFAMAPGEGLADLLTAYAEVAARTDDLVRTADLDLARALPEAPWFEPGATWTVRRVLLHLLAETSQHAGHADIIRESLDGARTMG